MEKRHKFDLKTRMPSGPPKQVLIEKYFPVEKVSFFGRKEKKGRPKTFEMHYWWTRKPIIVSRAALLGALLPAEFDPRDYERICGLAGDHAPYKVCISADDKQLIHDNIMAVYGHSIEICDPFAGGGSIPFVALEAGLDVSVNDYSPVAWLILKTALEYPAQYGSDLRRDVDTWGNWVVALLERELGDLYPNHQSGPTLAYIYTWMVNCAECGTNVPLVNSWKLAQYPDEGRSSYIEPAFYAGKWNFSIKSGRPTRSGTCNRAIGTCLNCGAKIPNTAIITQLQAGAQECLLAIVTNDGHRKQYVLPNTADLEAIAQSLYRLEIESADLFAQDLIPIEKMPLHTIRPAKYLLFWRNLFNPRQLLFFAHFTRLVRDATSMLVAEKGLEYGRAVGAYLTLLLGKLLDYNCRVTAWIAQREGILHACSNKLNAIQWDHAEINPFSRGSGSLANALRSILQGIDYAIIHLKRPPIQVTNASIFSLPMTKYDIILTDLPYFDDAPYGELGEFFHVWESRAVGAFFADVNPVFAAPVTPKKDDISVSYERRGDRFRIVLHDAFVKIAEMIQDFGLAIFFFAHSGLPAWESAIYALQESQFVVTATWPVHTENLGISNWAKGSVFTSVIIVARKQVIEKPPLNVPVQPKITAVVRACLEKSWSQGFRGADLAVGAFGATLRVLSQYSGIETPSGTVPFGVLLVLEHVRSLVADYIAENS